MYENLIVDSISQGEKATTYSAPLEIRFSWTYVNCDDPVLHITIMIWLTVRRPLLCLFFESILPLPRWIIIESVLKIKTNTKK